MIVLALDIATTTGFARGKVGDVPTCGSVNFESYKGCSDDAILASCFDWMVDQLRPMPRPDKVVIEALLSANAKIGFTNADTTDRLRYLHGVIRTVIYKRGIFGIKFYPVQDIRQHFIGDRMMPRHKAKKRTIAYCRALGWPVEDDDAGDACALWHLACSEINPDLALQVSPLFNKAIREVA